jgi:hypothetical protein
MATSITLDETDLPQVSEFSVGVAYIGGAAQLADGGLRRDLMDASAKRRFSLAWTALSASELGDVLDGFDGAVAGDVDFDAPDGGEYTVNAGTTPSLRYEAYVVAGGNLLYRCSMELWEA